MGLGENKWSARTGRAEKACFRAVIVIWLYYIVQTSGQKNTYPLASVYYYQQCFDL